MLKEKRISPGVIIAGGIALGLAATVGVVAIAFARLQPIELQPGGNGVIWKGEEVTVAEALGDCMEHFLGISVWNALQYLRTGNGWVNITSDTILIKDSSYSIRMSEACTVTGFVWHEE